MSSAGAVEGAEDFQVGGLAAGVAVVLRVGVLGLDLVAPRSLQLALATRPAGKLPGGGLRAANAAKLGSAAMACPDPAVVAWASAILGTEVTVLRGLRHGSSPWLLQAGPSVAGLAGPHATVAGCHRRGNGVTCAAVVPAASGSAGRAESSPVA